VAVHRAAGRVWDPLSASTHNIYRQRLTSFLDWCVLRGYLDPRHGLLAGVESKRVVRRRRRQPRPALMLALLDAAENPRDRAWLAVATNTGLRSNEIARLRVADLDLEEGRLFVLVTKTGEEDRMPVSLELDAEMRRWLTWYATALDRPLHHDDLLVPAMTSGGYQYVGRDHAGRAVKERAPQVPKPRTPVTHSHRIVQRALLRLGQPIDGEGTHSVRRGRRAGAVRRPVQPGRVRRRDPDGLLAAAPRLGGHHRALPRAVDRAGAPGPDDARQALPERDGRQRERHAPAQGGVAGPRSWVTAKWHPGGRVEPLRAGRLRWAVDPSPRTGPRRSRWTPRPGTWRSAS